MRSWRGGAVYALAGLRGELPVRFAAEARQFTGDIDEFGPLEKEAKKAIRKGLKLMCRESQMGVAAAQLALTDAGLVTGQFDPEQAGCVFGTDYMLTRPEDFTEAINFCRDGDGQFDFARWGSEGMTKVAPLWLLKYLPNMPASHVAIYNDLRGPNNSITHREAAANLAIGEAFHIIARGSARIIVAGATGTRVHPMKSVHAAQSEELAADGDGADPAQASRPFDRNRTGMVLGEGAGVVILEELGSAQARGARIYAEIVGAGSSQATDRNYVARRDVALANVIRGSLAEAKLAPAEIGHINSHGLATHSSDADESRAIRDTFGDAADRVPVAALKSYFGNLGAGSGVIELIGSILAMTNERLPPILNYETPDPDCRITPAGPAHAHASAPVDFINLNVTPQGQASAVVARMPA